MNKVHVVIATTLLLVRSTSSFTVTPHLCFEKRRTINSAASTLIVEKDDSLQGREVLNEGDQNVTELTNSSTAPFTSTENDANSRDDITSPEVALGLDQSQKMLPSNELIIPSDVADTLDGRLICASQCAYNITQPYFRSSGYRPDTVAKRISRGVNSALIGITYDGITVAVRGTEASSSLDWIQNAALFLTPTGDRTGFQGKMHGGFYRATKNLWKGMREVLVEMLAISDEMGWKQDVFFTGHSKGGAMASVAALLMQRDGDLPDPTYVCTFGSARVGDSEFRDYYNGKINQTSYEAHLDIIPYLPPSASVMGNVNEELADVMNAMLWSEKSSNMQDKYKWDYQTVGRRKFIDEFSNINEMDVTQELDSQRLGDIGNQSVIDLADFRAAHCTSCAGEGCYGYYFKAVAEENCALCEEDDD